MTKDGRTLSAIRSHLGALMNFRKLGILFVLVSLPALAHATVAGTQSTVPFTCSNSTGPFPFTFAIPDVGKLLVIDIPQGAIPGVMTILSPNQWMGTPVNQSYMNGGTVYLVNPCPTGDTLVLARDTSALQATHYTPNMPALYANFENNLDQLTTGRQDTFRVDQVHIGNATGCPGASVTYTPLGQYLNLPCPGGGGGGGGTPNTFISGIPSGTINGTNTFFNISSPSCIPNSLLVWNNFTLIPSVGYTAVGSTLRFTVAPQTGDSIFFQCAIAVTDAAGFISSTDTNLQTMIGPLEEIGSGVYTGSAYNSAIQANEDGCDPGGQFSSAQGTAAAYSAITGCAIIPSTSTLLQTNGVTGLVSGVPGGSATNIVGVYGQAIVQSGSAWGGNFAVVSQPSSGTFMWGIEDDVNINNSADEARGLALIGRWNAQPSALGYAVDVQEPLAGTGGGGPYKWNAGIQFETRATNTAIVFGPQDQGPNFPSQKMLFESFGPSTNLLTANLLMDDNGGLNWIPAAGSTVTFGADASVISTFNGGTSSQIFAGYEPQLSSANTIATQVGISDTTNNAANFGYNFASSMGSASNFAFIGLQGGVNTTVDGSGNTSIASGTNVVFRCLTAGTLPIGAMTIVAGDCGTSTDTGLRVK
jgi:hypothetical protein